jgi:hypothetical protein
MSFIAALTLMFCIQSASAQSDIDANRMNRDINIMENVLQEMFKTRMGSEDNRIHVRSGNMFSFGRNNDIRGTYLPGYGVIFTISKNQPGIVAFSNKGDENLSYSFQYGGEGTGEDVSEESITNKIVEFLRDYGSTIGQLSDDDRVMVIFKAPKSEHDIAIFRSSGDEKEVIRPKIPTISVVATKSDLQTYRSGDLSADEFRNRLDISTAEANGRGQMDMKVMANIFETAFKESEEKSFRVSGSVDYLHLDNFGALFSFDTRYSSGGSWSLLAPKIEILKNARNQVASVKVQEEDSEEAAELEKKQAEQKQAVISAYDQFLTDLKEYLVDYGRTLSSVENNQYILVSVTFSSRYEEIPERIDMQIQKSTLAAMDRGNTSREQAINQIQVREY